ncbi:LLM class F420-dependent oxidoreductase [Rhodococcus oxybenzonivorans]|uniref:LLM class F420-dependent oxidoreductase n=1 Tax=Rhodococcus oxybenzonivorans TaxID=1990687 RepID=A0A2S2BZ21_9NOCA|nr:LLM class F420-dependent oxidoreductase [Rhodococcus oxybenzonivorans]AWK73886.1 LLM class F420-dependent oxidoreductase [Rhodococcus oxybenzonivorans]
MSNSSDSHDVSADPLRSLGKVGLWTQALDLQPASRAREVAAELEDLGYPTVWISEGLRREVLANSAMLLGATRQLVVATGIANIWARDPVAMAAGQLTLAEAFDDRFLLGLGVSRAAIVEGMRGQKYSSPLKRMADYLDAMDGVAYQSPRPAAPPPRVLAAVGPKMLELASRRAAGAHPYFVVPEHTAEARGILGSGPLLCPEQAVVLETDPGRAREIARRYAQLYFGFDSYRKDLLKHGFTEADFDDGGSDRVIDAVIAWGDVEAVQARVQAHIDAGADHVCVQVLPSDPTSLPLEQWRELAPALVNS